MKLVSLSSVVGSQTCRVVFRKTSLSFLLAVLVPAVMLVIPLYASADVINLEASIDGAQANAGAGTGSPGLGTATVTYDDVSNLLSWNIAWSGLNGTETIAHFHGPALPNQNAGVQVSISAVSPAVDSIVLNAQQGADLLAGLWYINIHTDLFSGGEIRGQVLVVPPVVDPPVVPTTPTSVPTLPQWALIILLMLLVLMVFSNRKRLI